jgi:hypothetical protein
MIGQIFRSPPIQVRGTINRSVLQTLATRDFGYARGTFNEH